MTFDRQGTGLSLLRIFLGIFFLSQGLSKIHWFLDSSLLSQRLDGWVGNVATGSISARYLHQIAIPYAPLFARAVPLGEITAGLALLVGFWTRVFAFVAFLMVTNFHIASGAMFTTAFLTNGYGLPILGGTLALAIGAVRLPWSVR